MITPEKIEEVKKRLVGVYNPLKIYLFGSYAWGQPTDESDLDVLIVVEQAEANDLWRSTPGDLALRGLEIDRDLIVLTELEFEKGAQHAASLLHKIKREGKEIYARA